MRIVLYLSVLSLLPLMASAKPPKQGHKSQLVAPKASVTQWNEIEIRGPAHGKARIQFLARGKNAFIGRLWLAPDAKVPIHRDTTEEYIVFIEGGGTISIDGTPNQVGPGTTVYMPKGAEVSFQNGPRATIAVQIFAGPSSADKYAGWPVIQTAH